MRTRVKICCIQSIDEARIAIAAGADALGLVGAMPSGPGPIADAVIAEVAAAVPPGVASFLLTSESTAADIADHARRCGTNTVQIVRHIEVSEAEALARALPGSIRRVQVLHVEDDSTLDRMRAYAPFVHAFLLDSGRPGAAELGGTGRVHDWEISRAVVRESPVPVFLAGGLKADNAARAIDEVGPWGLDLCSGVRTDGALDPAKLRAFMSAVRGGASA